MATIFVNSTASGSNNGSSWDNAYTRLEDALSNASAGDEVWVASGVYKPTALSDREASFVIPDDVKVYGGFAGGESNLSERNIGGNRTILSGDIGTNDDNTDNSYHVVTLNGVTRDTVVDGFSIVRGNADNFSGINGSGGGIYAFNSSAVLQNLILAENEARFGGGMYSEDSQHQILNVTFLDNAANSSGDGGGFYTSGSTETLSNVTFGYNFSIGEGGGIFNNRSTLTLDDVEFIANRANGDGGGVYTSGQFTLSNGLFLNNSALDVGGGIVNIGFGAEGFNVSETIFKSNVADRGAGIFNSQTNEIPNTVTDSLFVDNYSRLGGGIYNFRSSPRVINSTFANNISQFGAGVSSEGDADDQTSIINSIFWDNLSIFGRNPINDSGSVTGASFSLVEDGFTGTENINADPQFVNPDSFDYRLSSGSPALNSGTNDDTATTDETDLAGNPRIVDSVIDIGAYEGAELEPVPTEPLASDGSTIVFVDRDATGGENNGASWANAYTNLRTAIENAPFGSQIWVAEGTYLPSLDNREISFQLRNGVSLYGGFNGTESSLSQRNILANETILSGELGQGADINDNSYHVVNASNVTNSTVLDGFTIRGGNADEFSGINGSGGGIYSNSSQAIFRNLQIEDNDARFGAGIFIEENSSHRFENVTFARNSSTSEGGAIYNQGSSFFFAGEFLNNTAEEEGGAIYNESANIYIENARFDSNRSSTAGGAIYFNDFSRTTTTYERIVNSVFNNNESPTGGAIYNLRSNAEGVNLTFTNNEAENGAAVFSAGREDDVTPEYFNSIFWDNTGTTNTAQIVNDGENTIVRNSIVEGGFSGQENLDVDPSFVDLESGDLRIKDDSPAIDAGLNDVVLLEEDLLGNPRIVNGTVDIGAYEFSEPYISIDDPEVIVGTTSGEPTEDENVTFTIRLVDSAGQPAPQDGEVTIDYLTLGNTAVVDDDYVSTSGTVTFAPGDTEETVTVPVLSNTASEGQERFFLSLSEPTGGIIDFDNRGIATISSVSNLVSISIDDATVTEGSEGETTLEFTVTLSEAAEQTVTTDYEINDSTAIAGEDYTDTSGTLTFEPGETSKTIAVTVLADTVEEDASEQFFVNLTNSSSNAEFGDSRGIGTITDDDGENTGRGELETIELFRFRNTTFASGTYVFVGEQEREDIRNNPDFNQTFSLDGLQSDGTINPAFTASLTPGENLIPFFRLASNDILGTFLFVSTAEYDDIFAPDSDQRDKWERQGLDGDGNDIPEFYLLDGSADEGTEFNRFQNTQNGTFLYAGPGETANIESDPNLSSLFRNQGVAFESL